jgi:hypothetical protein
VPRASTADNMAQPTSITLTPNTISSLFMVVTSLGGT